MATRALRFKDVTSFASTAWACWWNGNGFLHLPREPLRQSWSRCAARRFDELKKPCS